MSRHALLYGRRRLNGDASYYFFGGVSDLSMISLHPLVQLPRVVRWIF